MGSVFKKKAGTQVPKPLQTAESGAWWPGKAATPEVLTVCQGLLLNFPQLPIYLGIPTLPGSFQFDRAQVFSTFQAGLYQGGRVDRVVEVQQPPEQTTYLHFRVRSEKRSKDVFLELFLRFNELELSSHAIVSSLEAFQVGDVSHTITTYLISPFSARERGTPTGVVERLFNGFSALLVQECVKGDFDSIHRAAIFALSESYECAIDDRLILWHRAFDALFYAGDIEAARAVAGSGDLDMEDKYLGCHLADFYGVRLPAMICCYGALGNIDPEAAKGIEARLFPTGIPAPDQVRQTLEYQFGPCLGMLCGTGYFLSHPRLNEMDPAMVHAVLKLSLPAWRLWFGDAAVARAIKVREKFEALVRELRGLLEGLLEWWLTSGVELPEPPPMPRLVTTSGFTKARPRDDDETVMSLRETFKRGDWAKLEGYLSNVKDVDEREFLICNLAEWEGRPEWVADCTRQNPNSGLAWLISGLHSVYWAWDARGTGRSVKQEPLFKQRLALARSELFKAAELTPADPDVWASMLGLALGLRLDQTTALDIYTRLVGLAPDHCGGHRTALQYYCRKWMGSHEQMFQFARDVSRSRPEGSELHVLIACAHMEYLLDHQFKQATQYLQSDAVWPEIEQAYKKSLLSPQHRETRNTVKVRNIFCCLFWLALDRVYLPSELQKMKGQVTNHPWDSYGIPLREAQLAWNWLSRTGKLTPASQ